MGTEETNPHPVESGTPAAPWDITPQPAVPAKPVWSARKVAVVSAAVVALGGAVAGGVALGSHSSAGTSAAAGSAGTQQPGRGRPTGGPRGGAGGPGGGVAAAIHGDFVVPDGKGGFTKERTQTGKVTAVSATSVTLASDDGYTGTYTITPTTTVDRGNGTINDVKTGDSATVVATLSGDTATATRLDDRTIEGQSGQQAGPPNGPGPSNGP